MKIKNLTIIALYFSLLIGTTVTGQTEYYKEIHDASSYEPRLSYQDSLDAVAERLVSVFKDHPTIQNQFKVLSGNFYTHSSDMQGGIPEAMKMLEAKASRTHPYYLLIGKESNESGIYQRFWVTLKLPEEELPCFGKTKRETMEEMAALEMNKIHEANGKKVYKFAEAEKAGIQVVQGFLKEFMDCCLLNARSSTNCSFLGLDTITTILTKKRGMLYFDVEEINASEAEYGNIDATHNITLTNNGYPWNITDELSTLASGMNAARDSIKLRYFDDFTWYLLEDYLDGKENPTTAALRNSTSDFFHEVIVLQQEGKKRVFFRFSEDAKEEILDKWGLKLTAVAKPKGLYYMAVNLFFEKCLSGKETYLEASNSSTISSMSKLKAAMEKENYGIEPEGTGIVQNSSFYIQGLSSFQQINEEEFMTVTEEADVINTIDVYFESVKDIALSVGSSMSKTSDEVFRKTKECRESQGPERDKDLAFKIINELICAYHNNRAANIDLSTSIKGKFYSTAITLFDGNRYTGLKLGQGRFLGFKFEGFGKGTVETLPQKDNDGINPVFIFTFKEGGELRITTTQQDAILFEKLFNINPSVWDDYSNNLIEKVFDEQGNVKDIDAHLITSMPKCALEEETLGYANRIKLIDYFLNQWYVSDGEESAILDLIGSCPVNEASQLITDLQRQDRLERMFGKIHNTGGLPNFNRMGTELAALYYKQPNVEALLRDTMNQDSFFLAKNGDYTIRFSTVDYRLDFNDDQIEITKKITTTGFADPSFDNDIGPITYFSNNPFEIVNVKIGEGFPHLRYKVGEVVPMPWVYCAYLAANYQSEKDIEELLFKVDILAFAIGIGELSAVIRAKRLASARGFFAVAETVKLPLDAVVMSSDELCGKISSKEGGAEFCKTYQQLSLFMDVILLSGTAIINTKFVDGAKNQWKNLNEKNPNLADDLGAEQHHKMNRIFQNRASMSEQWRIIQRKVSSARKQVADWLGELYFNKGKVELKHGETNPKQVEVHYENQKIAVGDTDGNLETFDNGIMQGDFEATDIREISNRKEGIVCITRNGQKKCGIVNGACFVAGTLVKTPEGHKPIETIQAGDLVVSYDIKKEKSVVAKVRQAFTRGVSRIYQVVIGKDTIKTTAEHPFYTNNGWQPASNLKKGIKILSLASTLLAVDTVYAFDSLATVYNFEVEERHNYFVGEEGVLVHNSCVTKEWIEERLGRALNQPQEYRRTYLDNDPDYDFYITVEDLDGIEIKVYYNHLGFPDFSSESLPSEYWFRNAEGNHTSDFKNANEFLLDEGPSDIAIPNNNINSSWFLRLEGEDWVKYTWHHHEDGLTLVPVRQEIHNNSPHTGGVAMSNAGLAGVIPSP